MSGIRPDLIAAWETARNRHHLSHAVVRMAYEMGMNPKKLGKIDNHKQERWKAPLPEFIAHCYEKRFGRIITHSESLAVLAAQRKQRKREKSVARKERKAALVNMGISLPDSGLVDAATM